MPSRTNALKQNDETTVKVIVPTNLGPDRRILVQTPDGRTISAVVPKECTAGSAILVQVPVQVPTQETNKNPQRQPQPPSVQTIRVPEGKRKKGEKFRVRLPEGRTILATVPFNGCKEFSLDTTTKSKQQKQQNWHDNPLAVAPMFLGPLM